MKENKDQEQKWDKERTEKEKIIKMKEDKIKDLTERVNKLQDQELVVKSSKEEVKKKQKEIEKLKKEVSKQIDATEEERREKSKWERKVIQTEENYNQIAEVNKNLEKDLDKARRNSKRKRRSYGGKWAKWKERRRE